MWRSAVVLAAIVGAAHADAKVDRDHFVVVTAKASSTYGHGLEAIEAAVGTGTSWCSAGTTAPVGEWVELTFDRPIHVDDIGVDTALTTDMVNAGADDHFARATAIDFTTSDGRVVSASLDDGAFHAPLGGAPIRSLRATVKQVSNAADRVTCISMIVPLRDRTKRGDTYTFYGGPAAGMKNFVDDMVAIYNAVAACDPALLGKVMTPTFDRWASHPDRHIAVKDGKTLAAACREHHYHLAMSAKDLVDRVGFASPDRAVSFGAEYVRGADNHWRFSQFIEPIAD